jgi:hypothetical protein
MTGWLPEMIYEHLIYLTPVSVSSDIVVQRGLLWWWIVVDNLFVFNGSDSLKSLQGIRILCPYPLLSHPSEDMFFF